MNAEMFVVGVITLAIFVILVSIMNGLTVEALEPSTMASQVIIEGGFRE